MVDIRRFDLTFALSTLQRRQEGDRGRYRQEYIDRLIFEGYLAIGLVKLTFHIDHRPPILRQYRGYLLTEKGKAVTDYRSKQSIEAFRRMR
jgi:hypothetical protein